MMRQMIVPVALITLCSGCATHVGLRQARHRVRSSYTSLIVEGPYKTKQDVVTTNEDLILTIDQAPEHANPGDPNLWEHHFRAYCHVGANTPNTITVHNTSPATEVTDGWAYFSGQHPVGQTTKGVGAGDGTTFAIRCDSAADLFVNMSTAAAHVVWVTHLQSHVEKTLTPGTFCYVKDDGTITDPAPNTSSGKVQDFVNEVLQTLNNANF